MKVLKRSVAAIVALAAMAALAYKPAAAANPSEELVIQSQLLIEKLREDPEFASYRVNLQKAKGVLIIPSILKAGFIVGGEGGSGVLLGRAQDGSWSYPAFFTMGAGSFGLQIGVQHSQIVFLIMTDAGLNAVISNEVKLGVDASVAVGPLGRGIEGSTTTAAGGDIVAYSRSVGAFAGGAFEGAVIHERGVRNAEYYGSPDATARRIILQGAFSNPHADGLRGALASYPTY